MRASPRTHQSLIKSASVSLARKPSESLLRARPSESKTKVNRNKDDPNLGETVPAENKNVPGENNTVLDENKDGVISKDELAKLLGGLGEELDADDCAQDDRC